MDSFKYILYYIFRINFKCILNIYSMHTVHTVNKQSVQRTGVEHKLKTVICI